MRFEEVYPAIPRFFPFFGERVSMLFRRLLEKLAGKDLRDIDAVMKMVESETAEEYKNSVWKTSFTKARWISWGDEHDLRDWPLRRLLRRRRPEDLRHVRRVYVELGVSWLSTSAREAPSAVACSALRIKASTHPQPRSRVVST